jgi:peptide/nickel transport system substrate-binding protein
MPRTRPRRALPLRLTIAVLVTALACLGVADAATAAAKPRSGGSLTYIMVDNPVSMDPATFPVPTNQSTWGPPAMAVFDALAVINSKTFEVEPRLLQSFKSSSDGKVWTLKLRPNLKFSDGTPLNADAVKVNFERIADPATRATQAVIAQQIGSMRVVDQTTLEVTLTAANGFFPYAIADNLPFVVSPTQIRNDPTKIATAPIGAGPFVLKEWVRGSRFTFDRNPNYSGKVYLDQLIINVIPDYAQIQSTMVAGGAPMGFFAQGNMASQLAQNKDYKIDISGGGGGYMLFFNMRRPPFDDLRARQAVLYAIDQAVMSETLSQGALSPARAMFDEGSPYFVKGTQQPAPNAKKAQALLDELAAAGKPLSFTLLSSSATGNQGEFLQAALSKFRNVTAKLEVLVNTEFQARSRAGTFDLAVSGAVMTAPDPVLANYFSSTGQSNFAGYSNPSVDAAIARGRAATDVAEQRKEFDTALKQIFKDVPVSLMLRAQTAIAVNTKQVGGFATVVRQTPDFTKLWSKRR